MLKVAKFKIFMPIFFFVISITFYVINNVMIMFEEATNTKGLYGSMLL